MKNLSEIEAFIEQNGIQSVSFDIDGTVYPIKKVQINWWKSFFSSPIPAMRFLKIRKTWEKRRQGNQEIEIKNDDVEFFEEFLADLLNSHLVPSEMRAFLNKLENKNIIFLSDHGAERKLIKLGLKGNAINCLTQTGELKPHKKISDFLISKYKIDPKTHLHLGDRWTDEEQAKLLGSHFLYLIL